MSRPPRRPARPGLRTCVVSRPARLRPGPLVLALALVVAAPLAPEAAAQQAERAPADADFRAGLAPASPMDGPAFAVTRFEIGIRAGHEQDADLPTPGALLPMTVRLQPTPTGYILPRPGEPTENVQLALGERPMQRFHASALSAISRALLGRLHDENLLGVYVMPSAQDIDPESETDLRGGRTDLRFEIWIGRIKDVRTVAVGERIKGGWRVDHPAHRRILSRSPLAPADQARGNTTDLLRKDLLDKYLFQLNRHPGRHVEAALAASEDGEGITLDYRVFEPRPWSAYFQSSNTGTARTAEWQQRFGYIHRQLTGRDDILSMEFMNAGGSSANAINIAYESPWFRRGRPEWMQTTGDEPPWLRWFNRSKIPWWGIDKLRWRVQGGWNRFETSNPVNIETEVEVNDWNAAGGLTYNAFQWGNLFTDFYGGIRFRGVESRDLDRASLTQSTLFMGDLGMRVERINEYSTLRADFAAEGSTALSNSERFDSGFNRLRADSSWWLLRFDVGISHYLEPLLMPRRFRDPSTSWSSRLSHEISLGLRGQYAFDYRLIPQVNQVIGGLYSVRGFDPGTSVGDTVAVVTAEYRFHIPRALPLRRRPMQLPLLGDFRVAPQQVYGRPDWDLILRVFIDAGRSVRNPGSAGSLQNFSVAEFDRTLVGAGVGLELLVKGRFRARIDWARGIHQDATQVLPDPGLLQAPTPDDNDPNGRLHFLFSILY